MYEKKETFCCNCYTTEHHFFVERWPDEDNFPGETYVNIRLNKHDYFRQRVWRGIKYILGTKDGEYVEVSLSDHDRKRLAEFLEKDLNKE